MWYFQSLFPTLSIEGEPKIQFQNYTLTTNDPNLYARLKRNEGKSLWEIPQGESKEDPVKTDPPKKRGRPLGVKVVQGARSSEVTEKENET
jgi:hypothetical protein